MFEAPLSAYGWLVASIMLWLLLFYAIRFSRTLKIEVMKFVVASFLLIATSFTLYAASTFLADVEPQLLVVGFVLGDLLSVSFLALQPMIAWMIYGKPVFARWQVLLVLLSLGVVNFAVKIQPLLGDRMLTIVDNRLVKEDPGLVVTVIEVFFLSGLLITGISMLMRAGSTVLSSSRLKYVMLGVFSISGAGLYLLDTVIFHSNGVGQEVAIGNLVGYPLAVLVALGVFGLTGRSVTIK